MATKICVHPRCDRISRRSFCGRHWATLSDELRDEVKRTSRQQVEVHGALMVRCRAYFEDRMIGDHEISICRGRDCGADIVWMQTSRGKNIPVNADNVREADELFIQQQHVAHWSTCPNADEFRK